MIACGCQQLAFQSTGRRYNAAVAQRRGSKRAICSRGATLSLGAGLISDAQRAAHASLSGPRGRKMGAGVGAKVKTRCFPAAACINHLRRRPDGPSFFASRRRIHVQMRGNISRGIAEGRMLILQALNAGGAKLNLIAPGLFLKFLPLDVCGFYIQG